jgi:hypothetical protein
MLINGQKNKKNQYHPDKLPLPYVLAIRTDINTNINIRSFDRKRLIIYPFVE